MNKYINPLLVASLLWVTLGSAQAQTHFCGSARQVLRKIERSAAAKTDIFSEEERYEYVLLPGPKGDYVRGLILVNEDLIDETQLKALNISVSGKTGNIWNVEAPLASFPAFSRLKGVDFFEMDQRAFPLLDKARVDVGVDKVRQGVALPKGFTGKGVVCGLVDIGFYYNHQTFLDTNGNNRIVRVWEQYLHGTPPSGYNYGHEFTNVSAIQNRGRDTTDATHGSHVAGIIAGSGFGTGGFYSGMAPEADIAMVSSTFTYTSINQGVKYILDYAKSVNKPVVVNMSIGGFNERTMDGTSLHDKQLEEWTKGKAGVAVVVSAGNSGDEKMHYAKQFAGDTIRSILGMSDSIGFNGTNTGKVMCKVNMSGEQGKDFSVKLIIASNTGQTLAQLPFQAVSANANVDTTINVGGSFVRFMYSTWAAYPTNNLPRYQLYIHNKAKLQIAFAVTAPNGKVHIWNVGQVQGAPLLNKYKDALLAAPGYVIGDVNYTVGEPGTSKGVITVAAHTTKAKFTSIDGQEYGIPGAIEGAIASFSSFGPSVDGRVKPEISAPGQLVVSAFSDYGSINDTYKVDVSEFQENVSQYAALQGTSMSSPVVSGVVALMLEANPALPFEKIREIIIQTAREDSFTGDIPVEGDSTFRWGWGKIDAHAAVKAALAYVARDEKSLSALPNLRVYPNPTNGLLVVDNAEVESRLKPLRLSVIDGPGRVLIQKEITANDASHTILDLSAFAAGFYFLRVETATGFYTYKISLR